MMFRAEHGHGAIREQDRRVCKGRRRARAWTTRTHDGLLAESQTTVKGSASRPPDCKHTRPKGHAGAPPRQVPGSQPRTKQTL